MFFSCKSLIDGKAVTIFGKIYIGKPGSVCTDFLIPIRCFDSEIEANNLMKEMSEDEKAEFKTFPICRFWNQSED